MPSIHEESRETRPLQRPTGTGRRAKGAARRLRAAPVLPGPRRARAVDRAVGDLDGLRLVEQSLAVRGDRRVVRHGRCRYLPLHTRQDGPSPTVVEYSVAGGLHQRLTQGVQVQRPWDEPRHVHVRAADLHSLKPVLHLGQAAHPVGSETGVEGKRDGHGSSPPAIREPWTVSTLLRWASAGNHSMT